MMRASETKSTTSHSSRSVASASPASAEQQALSLVQDGGNQFFLSLVGRGAAQPRLRVAPTVQRKCAHCKDEEEKKGRIRRAQRGGGEDGSVDTAVAPDSVPAETLTEVPGETPSEVPTEPVAQTPSEAPGEAVSEPEPSSTAPAAPALLVEDGTAEVGPTQMKKTEFLDALRPAVCRAVDAGLSGTGLTSDGCPHVEYWFERAAGRSVSFIERTIQRFAPEAQGATEATEYIQAVASRVLQSSRVWATTRRIEGVPDEVLAAASASSEGEAGGEGIPRIQFKARTGGANPPDDVSAVRDELGVGRPLDGGVRARMESAFGVSFNDVRIHTDATGAELSDRFDARAFTVGEHVAFGAGEYRPGTLGGDVLIAHELAHVVQQGGHVADGSVSAGASEAHLERDADTAAGGAVGSLLGRSIQGLRRMAGEALPRLRSGLALQRCSRTSGAAPTLTRTVTKAPVDNTCGGFEMAARFSIDNATASTNGFVVQKLTFDLSRESCAGARNDFAKTYWEAWEVRQGVVYVGTSTSPHVADTFRVGSTPSHKGSNKEHGRAKYIDGYTEPTGWGTCPEAGSLPCTTTQPAGWTDTGTLHRYVESDFDCCAGTTTTRFDHQQ